MVIPIAVEALAALWSEYIDRKGLIVQGELSYLTFHSHLTTNQLDICNRVAMSRGNLRLLSACWKRGQKDGEGQNDRGANPKGVGLVVKASDLKFAIS